MSATKIRQENISRCRKYIITPRVIRGLILSRGVYEITALDSSDGVGLSSQAARQSGILRREL